MACDTYRLLFFENGGQRFRTPMSDSIKCLKTEVASIFQYGKVRSNFFSVSILLGLHSHPFPVDCMRLAHASTYAVHLCCVCLLLLRKLFDSREETSQLADVRSIPLIMVYSFCDSSSIPIVMTGSYFSPVPALML
jgi:hypothetical protein